MRTLILSNCGINEFPTIVKSLNNLEDIGMSSNKISGKVPEWLWNLPHMRSIDLSDNFFEGFEGSVDALVNSSVQVLMLDLNKFEGTLPHPPLSINTFTASLNSFTGKIPLSVCSISSLSFLDLSNNNFTGLIPRCLSNLTIVSLRKNNLEGNIPDEFYVDASLQTLDVGFNRLSGKLPKSLLNCSSLQFMTVENNRIQDTFPFWLKALPNLQVLNLRSNKFYGLISPPHQGPLGFPELRIMDISDNKFIGSLPQNYFINWKPSSVSMNEDGGLYMIYPRSYDLVSYGYMNHMDLQYKGLHMEQANVLTFFSAIDFSGNKLEGRIPDSIGQLKGLIALDLSNNAFTGHIPPSFGNLMKLESLDLSRNQLSGTIPNGLGTLSFLAYVNVSHNQLKGEIPQGTQITGQPKSCFEGNAGLCGLPLERKCFVNEPTQTLVEEDEEEEEQVLNWKAVVVGYGFGLILGLAIAHVTASCKPELFVKIFGRAKGRNC